MIFAYIDFEKRNFKKNKLLTMWWKFFSINISCFLVDGLYFFALSFILAFSPPAGFFT